MVKIQHRRERRLTSSQCTCVSGPAQGTLRDVVTTDANAAVRRATTGFLSGIIMEDGIKSKHGLKPPRVLPRMSVHGMGGGRIALRESVLPGDLLVRQGLKDKTATPTFH